MSEDSSCKRGGEALIINNEEIRIVIVGKFGAGKSATGNTIMGFKAFPSKLQIESLTTSCKKVKGVVAGRNVAIVDTPALFDTRFSENETLQEVVQCFTFSAPGPHVFLIVSKLGRFTEEEERTVEMLQKGFGEMSKKYTMMLFTGVDQLKDESVEDFLNDSPKLKLLIRKCEGRYHLFNNKIKDPSQVTELLEKINKMVLQNGGSHYTTEMFQETERAIEEEKQRILKEGEEKRRKEEEEPQKKYEADVAARVELETREQKAKYEEEDRLRREAYAREETRLREKHNREAEEARRRAEQQVAQSPPKKRGCTIL